MTEPPPVDINFATHEVYECGAALLALLAFPADREAAKRAATEVSLCAKYLRARYEGAEDSDIPVLLKPKYVLRAETIIAQDLRTFDRCLRDRMIAARMSIPYLQQAHGLTPTLPPGMARWSINELSALVLDDAQQSDPGNVETRIWRRSLPVIHLAAAVAVAINEGERTGHPHTSYGDILCDKNHSHPRFADLRSIGNPSPTP